MILERENTIKSLQNSKIENYFGTKIQELAFINKINLRINTKNTDYMKICGKFLNAILPTKPNTFTKNGNLKRLTSLGGRVALTTGDRRPTIDDRRFP